MTAPKLTEAQRAQQWDALDVLRTKRIRATREAAEAQKRVRALMAEARECSKRIAYIKANALTGAALDAAVRDDLSTLPITDAGRAALRGES